MNFRRKCSSNNGNPVTEGIEYFNPTTLSSHCLPGELDLDEGFPENNWIQHQAFICHGQSTCGCGATMRGELARTLTYTR